MTKISRAILAVALAIGLGGCQSFMGSSGLARSEPVDPATVDLSSYFAQRIEAGKQHLRANRPTQAINAFRQASYDPAFAATAYNGMGVAYAQMGRADVAKRYFGMAVAAAPEDERFARNLARLETQGAASEVQLAAQDAKPADAIPAAEAAAAPAQQAASAATPMLRVSDKEVQIQSRASSARPEVRVTTGRSVAAATELPAAKPRYPIRVALSDVSQAQASYPVRIELPKAK